MSMFWLQSPGLWVLLGAVFYSLMPNRWRDTYAVVIACGALALSWNFPDDGRLLLTLFRHEFIVQEVRPFSRIFAVAFSIALLGGSVFAFGQQRYREVQAALLYAGSALMICFCGDLLVLLLFWEVMAIGSALVLWFGGMAASRTVAMRYVLMHLLGGVLMLEGISLMIYMTDSTSLPSLAIDWITLHGAASVPMDSDKILHGYSFMADISIWLVFSGILVNLAAPPFSAWLADSYPEASPSGSVFLSAFTTKTAVYVLLTLFAGTPLLIAVGLFMVFYGIIYAMLENDFRRILSYSIVNQVGFMVVGIGIGSPLALYGAAAHAFCHIIYKALLMMTAGTVVQATGLRRCTDVGGLYHSMPFTTLCAMIGALAISAFPLTSGFVSKSMISAAAAEGGLDWVYALLLAASAGVFLHAGVKYPWFVFFQRDSGLRPKDPAFPMKLAMGSFALLCLLPGIAPELLYQLLPSQPEFEPNTAGHWVGQLQLLLFSGLAFFVLLPWLQRTHTVTLDMDWLYRNAGRAVLVYLWWLLNSAKQGIVSGGLWLLHAIGQRLRHWHQPTGIFARSVEVADATIWVGIALAVYLLSYYSAIPQ